MTDLMLPPALRSRHAQLALLTTGVGFGLGLLAPFGSYLNAGLVWRLLYWGGSVWLGLLLFGGAWLVWRRHAARLTRARWPALAAMLIAASLGQTVVTRTVALKIWPELQRYAPSWAVWYLQGLVIAVIGGGLWLVWRRAVQAPLPVEGGPLERPARAPSLGKDVIALQMEDHYVRIHTRSGSRLAHMTLTEAIEAVGPIDGLKVHRSWWVARDAVARIEGTPRAMRLHLDGGLVAPVARGAVALLRQTGWLGADAVK